MIDEQEARQNNGGLEEQILRSRREREIRRSRRASGQSTPGVSPLASPNVSTFDAGDAGGAAASREDALRKLTSSATTTTSSLPMARLSTSHVEDSPPTELTNAVLPPTSVAPAPRSTSPTKGVGASRRFPQPSYLSSTKPNAVTSTGTQPMSLASFMGSRLTQQPLHKPSGGSGSGRETDQDLLAAHLGVSKDQLGRVSTSPQKGGATSLAAFMTGRGAGAGGPRLTKPTATEAAPSLGFTSSGFPRPSSVRSSAGDGLPGIGMGSGRMSAESRSSAPETIMQTIKPTLAQRGIPSAASSQADSKFEPEPKYERTSSPMSPSPEKASSLALAPNHPTTAPSSTETARPASPSKEPRAVSTAAVAPRSTSAHTSASTITPTNGATLLRRPTHPSSSSAKPPPSSYAGLPKTNPSPAFAPKSTDKHPRPSITRLQGRKMVGQRIKENEERDAAAAGSGTGAKTVSGGEDTGGGGASKRVNVLDRWSVDAPIVATTTLASSEPVAIPKKSASVPTPVDSSSGHSPGPVPPIPDSLASSTPTLSSSSKDATAPVSTPRFVSPASTSPVKHGAFASGVALPAMGGGGRSWEKKSTSVSSALPSASADDEDSAPMAAFQRLPGLGGPNSPFATRSDGAPGRLSGLMRPSGKRAEEGFGTTEKDKEGAPLSHLTKNRARGPQRSKPRTTATAAVTGSSSGRLQPDSRSTPATAAARTATAASVCAPEASTVSTSYRSPNPIPITLPPTVSTLLNSVHDTVRDIQPSSRYESVDRPTVMEVERNLKNAEEVVAKEREKMQSAARQTVGTEEKNPWASAKMTTGTGLEKETVVSSTVPIRSAMSSWNSPSHFSAVDPEAHEDVEDDRDVVKGGTVAGIKARWAKSEDIVSSPPTSSTPAAQRDDEMSPGSSTKPSTIPAAVSPDFGEGRSPLSRSSSVLSSKRPVHSGLSSDPLPSIDVSALMEPPVRPSTKPASIKLISLDVLSVNPSTGSTAKIPAGEQHILYDTEVIAVIERFKTTELAESKVYGWVGRKATVADKAERKLTELARQYGTQLARCEQAGESAELVEALGGMIVVREGSRAHFEPSNIQMYTVRNGPAYGSIVIDQVDFLASNLSSAYSVVISVLSELYVWHGLGSSPAERSAAVQYAATLGNAINEVEEGDETIWAFLEEGEYAAARHHVFRPSWAAGVREKVFEISAEGDGKCVRLSGLSTASISPSGIYLVDAIFELHVLLGARARSVDRVRDVRLALRLAQRLSERLRDERPFAPPIHVVAFPSVPPRDLRSVFRSWNDENLCGGVTPTDMNLFTLEEALQQVE